MKTLTLSLFVLMLSLPAMASMEDIYAKQYGTCTKETCIKGDKVKVLVNDHDSTDVQNAEGEAVDAEKLKGLSLTVAANDDKCKECSVVTSPSGERYLIPRMFLKKTS